MLRLFFPSAVQVLWQRACHRLTSSLGLLIISFQCSSSLPRVYMKGPTTTRPSRRVSGKKRKQLMMNNCDASLKSLPKSEYQPVFLQVMPVLKGIFKPKYFSRK